jgi:hypothetical protein
VESAQSERRSWIAYALAAAFVLLASGAVLPHTSASFAALVDQLKALFF